MPTFDFQCQKCSFTFEFSRPFGSDDHPACPKCRSTKTEKLISPPSVMFKGTGFYKTDSTSKPSTKAKEEKPTPLRPEGSPLRQGYEGQAEKKEPAKDAGEKKLSPPEKK